MRRPFSQHSDYRLPLPMHDDSIKREPGYQQLRPLQELGSRAESTNFPQNSGLAAPTDRSYDAYLPSVDIELKYEDGKLDVGVFGPTEMISIKRAKDIVQALRKDIAFIAN